GNAFLAVFSLLQLALIVRRLTPAEQGVTFNFNASFQFQELFNLGFSVVIQQLASHQRVFLRETPSGVLAGDADRHARLAAILRLTVRWSVGMFVVWCVVMLPAGGLFFFNVRGLGGVDWQVGWVLRGL